MNTCVRAIVRTGCFYKMKVFAVMNGLQGLINGNIKEFGPRDVAGIVHRGGTILGVQCQCQINGNEILLNHSVVQRPVGNIERLIGVLRRFRIVEPPTKKYLRTRHLLTLPPYLDKHSFLQSLDLQQH